MDIEVVAVVLVLVIVAVVVITLVSAVVVEDTLVEVVVIGTVTVVVVEIGSRARATVWQIIESDSLPESVAGKSVGDDTPESAYCT